MLTSLEIENFKGIAERQRIDFAPLTLLFGANSAGKSTILHALLYLHELIERGTADVDRTELGGDGLRLGGFARLVHHHDASRAIVLRAEFTTPGSLERFGRQTQDLVYPPDLDDQVESAWLELTIRFRRTSTFRGPLVDRAVIGVNGDANPLVWIETGVSLREGDPLYVHFNIGHALLAQMSLGAYLGPTSTQLPLIDETRPTQLSLGESELDVRHPIEWWDEIAVSPSAIGTKSDVEGHDARERAHPTDRTTLTFAISRSRMSALPPLDEPLRIIPYGRSDRAYESIAEVRAFLEMLILGTTAQLASFLRDAIYIGPLRAVPSRGFLYERSGRAASWSEGLAAWDLLLSDRLGLVEKTNAQLRRLEAGCQILVQQLFDTRASAEELSADDVDRTVRRLLLDTGAGSLVLPSEVGAGISQMMPVVVAALNERNGLTLVEQPEIHVHPRMQVNLGDLFIEAATLGDKRRILLVETHSEHLILRLLRRIRETTDHELPAGDPPLDSENLSVIHVQGLPDGVRIQRLKVDERGEFTDRWPQGFFAERAKELF